MTGTHTVAVSATNDCGQAQDSLTVTTFCQPVLGLQVQGPRVLLVGQVVTYEAAALCITASPPLTYSWDSGKAGRQATYTWPSTGTYTFAVTVTGRCEQVSQDIVVNVLADWPYHFYLPLLRRGPL